VITTRLQQFPLVSLFVVFSVVTLLSSAMAATSSVSSHPTRYGQGWMEELGGLTVLHLKGSDREIGEQYGYLIGDRIASTVGRLQEIATTQTQDARLIPSSIFTWARRVVGFIMWQTFPKSAQDQIKGIQIGAKKRTPSVAINRYDVALINSVIDLAGILRSGWENPIGSSVATASLRALGLEQFVTNCDSFAAWGSRTVGGKTFQTRNVDISTGQGLEDHPVVLIVKPTGKISYVSATFAGMIGVFTGMNAYGVALGQIWTFSKDVAITSPWQLTFMEILRTAKTAYAATDQALIRGRYTYGNNFVIADSGEYQTRRQETAYVVEASGKRVSYFSPNDPRELKAKFEGETYGLPLPEAVLRGDLQLDDKLRSRQLGSNGPTGDPRTTQAYQLRYLGQYTRLEDYRRNGVLISNREAEVISRETAMRGTSLQAAVYANSDRDLWVSYARKREDGSIAQAYEGEYVNIPFYSYLTRASVAGDRLILSREDNRLVKVRVVVKRSDKIVHEYRTSFTERTELQLPPSDIQHGDVLETYSEQDRLLDLTVIN